MSQSYCEGKVQMMRNKTYHEMYDLLTQSMSLNHKMIDKIEELRTENAVLYKQIEECRDTLRTLILKDFESLNDNKRGK